MPFTRFIPNFTTITALCLGLSAIRMALNGDWQRGLWLVVIAMVLDALDGRLARVLGAESRFGAELDSLSDFVNFGVTPSLMVYIFALQHWRAFGWACVLLYCACAALRLARFNTLAIEGEDDPDPSAYKFFTGVPMPIGALLILSPLMLSVHFNATFSGVIFAVNTVIVATLLISRLPTYSLKTLTLSSRYFRSLMIVLVVSMAILISYPWVMLPLIACGYYISLAFSWRAYKRAIKITEEQPI